MDESNAKTKKKVFAETLGLFLDELVAQTTNKAFRQGMKIISAVYSCISIIEKKVACRMTIKGPGPSKMPWRAAFGPRAVGCRPLP